MTRAEYDKLRRIRRTLEGLAVHFPQGKPTTYWLVMELLDLVLENAHREFVVREVHDQTGRKETT